MIFFSFDCSVSSPEIQGVFWNHDGERNVFTFLAKINLRKIPLTD